MRIDKYLKISRIIKRRTVAKAACEQGRVTLNGKPAKPGAEVEAGDVVHIEFGSGSVTFRITMIADSVRKENAADMYEMLD